VFEPHIIVFGQASLQCVTAEANYRGNAVSNITHAQAVSVARPYRLGTQVSLGRVEETSSPENNTLAGSPCQRTGDYVQRWSVVSPVGCQ
jgi:hypothetical protein